MWPRLKACRQCGYAFFDRSKNRSAAWCAMSICGNRTKNRTYRRRRARTSTFIDLGELIGEASVRAVERYSHSIVPGGLLVTS